MTKKKVTGTVGIWFELDKDTNRLLIEQAERHGRSKRAHALWLLKQSLKKNPNSH